MRGAGHEELPAAPTNGRPCHSRGGASPMNMISAVAGPSRGPVLERVFAGAARAVGDLSYSSLKGSSTQCALGWSTIHTS